MNPTEAPRVHPAHYQHVLEMSTMNVNEARLRVHGAITEVLIEMIAEEDATDEELEELGDQMGELADIILEDIGLEVTSVNDDGIISATLSLYTDLFEDEAQ